MALTTFWRVVPLTLVCFLLFGCTAGRATVRDSAPSCLDSRAEVCQVANTGQVCFQPCQDCRRIEVNIEPSWRGSSSCTQVLSMSGTVRVDESSRSLHFETQYLIRLADRGPTPIACSADSAPLPAIQFGVGPRGLEHTLGQPSGEYRVWLGDSEIGAVLLPPVGRDLLNTVCLPPLPTPTPTPTYPGPTQTPSPNDASQPFISPISPLPSPSPS